MTKATNLFLADCEEVRKELGMYKTDLGMQAAGSFDHYARIMRGEFKTVQVKTLDKIARALGKELVISLEDPDESMGLYYNR